MSETFLFNFNCSNWVIPLPKINNHQTYFAAFILVKLLHFLTKLLVNFHNLPPETSLYVLVWRGQRWFCFHILLKKEIIIDVTLKNLHCKQINNNYTLSYCNHLHNNRPLLSSKDPHFQNEARCTTFLVKKSFICTRIKNDFHLKGWALNLVLTQRPGGTWK